MDMSDEKEMLAAAKQGQNGYLCESKEDEKKRSQNCLWLAPLKWFANGLDIVMIIGGTVCAIIHGVVLPLMFIVFGDMTDSFVDNAMTTQINNSYPNITITPKNSSLEEDMTRSAIYYSIMGFVALVFAYGQVALWSMSAGRQGTRIRKLFFHRIMQQDIDWFDVSETGELNTRLTE